MTRHPLPVINPTTSRTTAPIMDRHILHRTHHHLDRRENLCPILAAHINQHVARKGVSQLHNV